MGVVTAPLHVPILRDTSMRIDRARTLPISAFLFASLSISGATYAQNDIQRVSLDASGVQGNSTSIESSVSDNGALVAFASAATNLIGGDSNRAYDVFVKTRSSGAIALASSDAAGVIGNGNSRRPVISGNGQFVAFLSDATNLVAGDTNNTAKDGKYDLFVKTLSGGAIERVNVDSAELEANAGVSDVSISDDGRYVVFTSTASNLIASDTNGVADVFLRDRSLGTTIRISEASGVQADAASGSGVISGDGAYIAFASDATNLVGGDVNGATDVFRYTVSGGALALVSVSTSSVRGTRGSGEPSISDNGRYITFSTDAAEFSGADTNNLYDVYVRDMVGLTTTLVSQSATNNVGNGDSASGVISGDGTKVAFISDATNLIPIDTNNVAGDGVADVFVKTLGTGAIDRKNETLSESQVTGASLSPSIDDTGTIVAFSSIASGLVSGDSNNAVDIFATDESCSSDSDSDSVVDCTDGCPTDAAKTAPGICGCGLVDVDSDSDGTYDCNDACPSDAAKTAVGSCGCGAVDTDANGNGVADCSDPTGTTVPRSPAVSVRGKTVTVTVRGEEFLKVAYEFELLKSGRVVASKATRKLSVQFKNQRGGSYTVRYRLRVGATRTRYSRSVRATVR